MKVRPKAAFRLLQLGLPKIAHSLSTFNAQSQDARKKAAELLKKIGAPAVKYLIKALASKDRSVRRRVIQALGMIGDLRAIAGLIPVLRDEDASVRLQAAKTLVKLGWTPQQKLEQIAYYIAIGKWDALSPFGSQAVEPLLPLAQDHDRKVRKNVTRILTRILASIDLIVFGSREVKDFNPPATTLWNVEVSELTIPMSHLKRIELHTATYNFYQVERFITYAVNYIGQKYLKEQVEVHLYGDPDQLHQNLLNNFKNLCKSVSGHGMRQTY